MAASPGSVLRARTPLLLAIRPHTVRQTSEPGALGPSPPGSSGQFLASTLGYGGKGTIGWHCWLSTGARALAFSRMKRLKEETAKHRPSRAQVLLWPPASSTVLPSFA